MTEKRIKQQLRAKQQRESYRSGRTKQRHWKRSEIRLNRRQRTAALNSGKWRNTTMT